MTGIISAVLCRFNIQEFCRLRIHNLFYEKEHTNDLLLEEGYDRSTNPDNYIQRLPWLDLPFYILVVSIFH